VAERILLVILDYERCAEWFALKQLSAVSCVNNNNDRLTAFDPGQPG